MRGSTALLASVALAASAAHAQSPGAQSPGAQPPGAGMPPGPPPAMPSMADTKYDAALTISDGAISGQPADAIKGPAAIATAARGLSLNSSRPALNGLIVKGGKSAFTLSDSHFAMSGPGTNDFLGTGAGVLVRDSGTLVLDGVTIETSARISSAVVAAENAVLRVYNSHLVANGGPLPANYRPVIGPGMMEPPAPLGLTGTARTVLAMSNSRTFLYNSRIEADGWGALSTDATGGNLYLEANDCTVTVRKTGYGVYADFGAHVVINRSRIDSGGDLGIIAGKARIDFDRVTGRAGRNGVMIHSVMAFDPAETAELNLTDARFTAADPVVLVKSANADIVIKGGDVKSEGGMLLDVRKNDDPNATQTNGGAVPGVHLTITEATLAGDVIDSDPDRSTTLTLVGANLSGLLRDVTVALDGQSRWTARANSSITLAANASLGGIDAPRGVTVTARSADPALAAGTRTLTSGGTLNLIR